MTTKEQVQRYDCSEYETYEETNGRYVRYEDYAELETKYESAYLEIDKQADLFMDTIKAQQEDLDIALKELKAAQKEIEKLRTLVGYTYQMAGAVDAPVEWLDALSQAADGQPFSLDGLLPYPYIVRLGSMRLRDM